MGKAPFLMGKLTISIPIFYVAFSMSKPGRLRTYLDLPLPERSLGSQAFGLKFLLQLIQPETSTRRTPLGIWMKIAIEIAFGKWLK